VAYPCLAIEADPNMAAEYTSRGNLVGVVTNGTAVLGLGDIGPLAAKPVMEGKGCLFKKFAGIDVFDIELAEKDPKKLVEIIASLEPTLGGVNLEDIKAPECFYIEKALKERMKIPVFHDDQHGTAIISGAALLNGLELVGKPIETIKLVASGAGAAAIACLDIMVGLGVKLENIFAVDSRGVIQQRARGRARGKLDESKQRYCQKTAARTLADVVSGCDVFLGCSTAGVLTPEMVGTMAAAADHPRARQPRAGDSPRARQAGAPRLHRRDRPLGLSEPGQQRPLLSLHLPRRARLRGDPHHRGDEARVRARDRGARQGRAQRRGRRRPMRGRSCASGPTTSSRRRSTRASSCGSRRRWRWRRRRAGVATRPIADIEGYRRSLDRFVYQTGMVMRPLFAVAKSRPARVAFAEGEDDRVLRAIQVVLDEGLAKPILIGRPAIMQAHIQARRPPPAARPRLRGREPGGRSAPSRLLRRLPRPDGPPG
jgi:malate dehydrogenase (oxaloacetate-decarboxylating)(NADP+)